MISVVTNYIIYPTLIMTISTILSRKNIKMFYDNYRCNNDY
jgi:hypothetical protein